MFFLKRIPKIEHVIPVYAVIVTITYTWSMLQFFWNLPSWFHFSSIGEVFVIFTYMTVVNLIESLLALFFILAVFFILPPVLVSDQFTTKAALIAFTGLGFLIYRNIYFPVKALSELTALQWASLLGFEVLILLAPFNKLPVFCKVIENLADRFIIFLYIIIPASALSLVVVLFRNLF
jgi:hypothetical protein